MATPLTKNQLQKVLDQVTADLTELLKAEAIDKADEGTPAPNEVVPSGSAIDPPGDEDKEKDGEKDEKEDKEKAKIGEGPTADASLDSVDDVQSEDKGDEPAGEDSVDALKAEYAKMPVEILKAHFLAAKAALMGALGVEDGAGEEKEPGDKGEDKGEIEALKSEVEQLSKSLSAKDEQIETIVKAVEALTQGLEVALKTPPLRKSVTQLSQVGFIPKTAVENPDIARMTREQIVARLTEIGKQGKLAKSDKDLVFGFCTGKVKIEQVAHLLAK